MQLSHALLFFAMKYNKQVIQKYIVRGQTQIEVDSVHALVERSVRINYIYTPESYIPIIKMAKKNEPFYKVKYVDHTFFHDFSAVDYYSSICPGRLSGDPKVVNISQLKYDNEGLFYRLKHTDKDWKLIPQRRKDVDVNVNLKRQYEAQLPITTSKWNVIQSSKSLIPADFHTFYDNLRKKLILLIHVHTYFQSHTDSCL